MRKRPGAVQGLTGTEAAVNTLKPRAHPQAKGRRGHKGPGAPLRLLNLSRGSDSGATPKASRTNWVSCGGSVVGLTRAPCPEPPDTLAGCGGAVVGMTWAPCRKPSLHWVGCGGSLVGMTWAQCRKPSTRTGSVVRLSGGPDLGALPNAFHTHWPVVAAQWWV